jgi:hypothetical protein
MVRVGSIHFVTVLACSRASFGCAYDRSRVGRTDDEPRGQVEGLGGGFADLPAPNPSERAHAVTIEVRSATESL